ncbi:syndecan-2 [Spea bombifrons]|uniref:syndecan-2 n=1 Tax=Spea bombifrons TaxID=233779 RepID=UPI00234957F9|nr:syndecan-2 [Spea bombifrons]
MRNIWILLTFGLFALVSGETWVKTTTSDKDLYIDNTSDEGASGSYPIDDDDYSSGSGSGSSHIDDADEVVVFTTPEMLPDVTTDSDAPSLETTTLTIKTNIPPETEESEEPVRKSDTEQIQVKTEIDVRTQKHTENLFHRTEVLAAVIAGGGIGFLFAVFLILLLVYRMRKKDEGSYDLGERKPSSAVYQKAPTKEFYA